MGTMNQGDASILHKALVGTKPSMAVRKMESKVIGDSNPGENPTEVQSRSSEPTTSLNNSTFTEGPLAITYQTEEDI